MEVSQEETVQRTGSAASEPASDHMSQSSLTNGKRKAETELTRDSPPLGPKRIASEAAEGDAADPPLSKNQLKRLRKKEQYEIYKQERKVKRKDRRHAKQERKRVEREAKIAAAEAAGIDPQTVLRPPQFKPILVPVGLIIDCDFEQYMRDPEIVSLSSQIVRSYSVNRKAKYQGHLFISSWGGKMRERFETVYGGVHKRWKGVHIVEGEFREAGVEARHIWESKCGGEIIDSLKANDELPAITYGDNHEPIPEGSEPMDINKSVVYLTADSPYTIERLEPNTSYVIGGLVDRNREKGLCYKKAQECRVRTAKLPIGEYMAMQSRFVLTTNQVVEIMIKWLECGNWGEAFMGVIPKRKGGILKTDTSEADQADENEDQDDDHADEDMLEGDTLVVDEAMNGDESGSEDEEVSQVAVP
ncbi:guanine-1-methyltransferase-domain-containing protein [Echria macrotheca]|uniref:tRNA (guanine(9)-N1)-methyltransferase n=1 Tax=Echria macrotheca TaxID=438768 RepID=A0AAJ0B7D8_9PEZI|nr:guanine-1-methyltransferase-domain-containing protein [Echria macrotheca]